MQNEAMKMNRRIPGFFYVALAVLSSGLIAFCPPAVASPVAGSSGQQLDVIVKGVATPFAAFGLMRHLCNLPGVGNVRFHLSQGLAELTLKPAARLTDAEIRVAIHSASYTFGSVTRNSGYRASAETGPRPVRHS
jgi:hypothetical protein